MIAQSDRIASLIGEIYDAGVEPQRWSAVLGKVCDEIGAIGSVLGYYEPSLSRGQTAAYPRLDPDLLEVYHARYVDNVWNRSIARHVNDSRALFLDRLVPLRVLRKTAFYADVLAPQRIVSSMVVNFLGDDRGVGGISFMFTHSAADAPRGTLERADLLSQHVRRAVGLNDRLNIASTRQQAAEEAIDQLRRGVLTLGEDGTIRFMNVAARRMVAARDGLTVENGRLRALDPACDRQLAALLGRTLQVRAGKVAYPAGVLMVRRLSARSPYLLTIVPSRSETHWPPAARPAALCFITDPAAEHQVSAQMLAHLYGFTPTETRIALAIADGRSLPEAARECGIRPTTARTHLQGVFDKAGVRSQARLVQLITHILRGLPIEERRGSK